MEYREVIAYNENLVDGSVKTLMKEKPLGSIRGVATIELFNSNTGEMLYKAETENVINNSVGRLIFLDCFYRRLRCKGSVTSTYIKLPFKRLYLSDYAGLEDPNEKYFKGEVIGWADKDEPYSGSSTQQGTINLGESYSEFMTDGKLRMHFVFDFPTHAANGTFQTIYWYQEAVKNSVYSTEVNIFNTSTIEQKHSVICDYASYTCSDYENTGYYLYSKSISGAYYRVFRSFNLDTATNKQTEYMHFYKEDGSKITDSESVNGIAADSNNLYLYYNRESSIDIYKFQLDGTWISKTTMAATSYKNSSGIIPVIKDFSVIEGVPYMALYYRIDGSYECHLLKLNETFGILEDKIVETPSYGGSTWYINAVAKTKDYWILSDNNSRFFFYDNSFKLLIENINMSTWISSSTKRYFYSKNHSYGYCLTSYSSSSLNYYTYYVFGPSRIGAQTLLAAPVTKTPTNTMKIQYDFIVDNLLDYIF